VLGTFGQSLKEAVVPLVDVAGRFAAQVLAPEERKFWISLVVGLIAVDLFYRCLNRPKGQSFWSYAVPWRINAHPSAVLDYKFLVVQKLVIVFIITPMLVSALALGNLGSKLLASLVGPGPGWTPGATGLVLFAGIGLVLFDIGHFLSHYVQHKVPFFWEFHKIHHAAEVLTPVTAFRAHPVETILDSLFQAPLQALGLAVFYYLYGGRQFVVTFVGMNGIVLCYYLIGNLRHTHLWISFGPKLEHILCSPAQHQIHHSRAVEHLDTNFSEYFSFIDWIAGTLYVPKGQEALDFGLSEGPDPEFTTVWSLYWVPMKRAFRRLLPANSPRTVGVISPTNSVL
jgi:sterol desaturase/sphingolipid hydroxylase (fatty acid hydroxylase superfamily)